MDGGGVDSLSHSLLSPPTTSNFISPASHPHLSAECSTQSSRGGSAHPDLWLSVLNQFGSIRASLAIWIGEVKFHFPRPGRERPRIPQLLKLIVRRSFILLRLGRYVGLGWRSLCSI